MFLHQLAVSRHLACADFMIGALTLLMLILTLPQVRKLRAFDGQPDFRSTGLKLLRIDWLGGCLTIGFVTCLGVGPQWGGIAHKWSDIGVVTVRLTMSLAKTVSHFCRGPVSGSHRVELLDGLTRNDSNATFQDAALRVRSKGARLTTVPGCGSRFWGSAPWSSSCITSRSTLRRSKSGYIIAGVAELQQDRRAGRDMVAWTSDV